jgi:hypothetical protein
VYTDANIVMGAESADLFFYCWSSKVLADDGIWHVPMGGIHEVRRSDAFRWHDIYLTFHDVWCKNPEFDKGNK